MEIVEDSGKAIELLNNNGFYTIVISNQSLIGAGCVTENTVQYTMDIMCRLLKNETKSENSLPNKIIYPPQASHPLLKEYSNTGLCKPSSILMKRLLVLLGLDHLSLYMVGDRISDIEAGLSLNSKCYFIKSSKSFEINIDGITKVKDLYEAAKDIVSNK